MWHVILWVWHDEIVLLYWNDWVWSVFCTKSFLSNTMRQQTWMRGAFLILRSGLLVIHVKLFMRLFWQTYLTSHEEGPFRKVYVLCKQIFSQTKLIIPKKRHIWGRSLRKQFLSFRNGNADLGVFQWKKNGGNVKWIRNWDQSEAQSFFFINDTYFVCSFFIFYFYRKKWTT